MKLEALEESKLFPSMVLNMLPVRHFVFQP